MVDLNPKNMTIKESNWCTYVRISYCLLCNIHHEHMHLLRKDHASKWIALYDFVILCVVSSDWGDFWA